MSVWNDILILANRRLNESKIIDLKKESVRHNPFKPTKHSSYQMGQTTIHGRHYYQLWRKGASLREYEETLSYLRSVANDQQRAHLQQVRILIEGGEERCSYSILFPLE